MALDINKYIKVLKKDKKLLVPIVALLVVFAYFSFADFFKGSSKSEANPSGSITLEENFYDKKDVEKANSRVTDTDENQRKLIVEEELEVEQKAKEGEGSYIKKIILNDKENNDLKIKGINDSASLNTIGKEELPAGCKKDFITKVIVCVEENGDTTFNINNQKVQLNETICKTPPYEVTQECINLINNLKKEKEKLEAKLLEDLEKDKVIEKSKNNSQKQGNNKPPVEQFGSDKNTKEYKKKMMLLSLTSNNEANIIASKGSTYTGVNSLLKDKNSKDENLLNDKKEAKLFIKPGSSYIGTLINPLNSLYQEVKPIINIEAGDLRGYRLVGEISSNEASGGLIINGTKVVSPEGVEANISFVAIRNNDGELTPLFVDEIDRHLMGKIGYTVLGALTNDYASQVSGNNRKDSNSINFGETTSTETGDQLSQTFSEIAQQYRTEIKVNPQSMIIIFY